MGQNGVANTPQAWEQRPDESSEAYRAFRAYRDLGPDRSMAVAYRQRTGKDQAKQASGVWNGWAKRFDWPSRARAYDAYQEQLRQRSVDLETIQQARKWAARREQHLDAMYELGRSFISQARTLALMPVVQKTVEQDGRVTIYEAVDTSDLRRAAAVATLGDEMVRQSYKDGLQLEHEAVLEAARPADPAKPDGSPARRTPIQIVEVATVVVHRPDDDDDSAPESTESAA